MRRRVCLTLAALAVVAVAILAAASPAAAQDASTFRVTIVNLLRSGQPLTPPAVAASTQRLHVFDVGAPASFGVKEIAENGNLMPLLNSFAADPRVSASLEAPGGPLMPLFPRFPGSAMFRPITSFQITAPGARFLSFVSMLICTNDGFTGAADLRLPTRVGGTVFRVTNSYDAGTEVNTEDFAHIVPPCQALIGVASGEPGMGMSNPALAEGGVIHMHPGIAGIADLVPRIHGWRDPVALIAVTAVG